MLTFQVSDQNLMLGSIALIISIVLLIGATRWYFRRKFLQAERNMPEWKHQKNLPFDPLRHNSAFFQVGLIVALGFTLLAFNWTKADSNANFEAGEMIVLEDIEQAPPRTEVKPPPPPPPPPSNIVDVPEEELPDEVDDFVDSSIDPDDEVFVELSQPKPKPLPKVVPLPPVEDDNDGDIFMRVEKMPAFPGCEELDGSERSKCTEKKVFNYIFSNLRYPAIARENNVEGTVVLSFVVNKQGKVDKLKILRDIGAGCGDAALSTLTKMQKEITFKPGQQQARAVNVQYNLPIKFKLQ